MKTAGVPFLPPKMSGLVAVTVLSVACSATSHPAGWYANQELVIASAVLQDVAEDLPKMYSGPKGLFCICSGNDLEGAPKEPTRGLVPMLREQGLQAYPLSECDVTTTHVKHRATGQDGILLGVGAPEWRGTDFVRVKAWWFASGLTARSWLYTVARSDGAWKVMTAKPDKVALARPGMPAMAV